MYHTMTLDCFQSVSCPLMRGCSSRTPPLVLGSLVRGKGKGSGEWREEKADRGDKRERKDYLINTYCPSSSQVQ